MKIKKNIYIIMLLLNIFVSFILQINGQLVIQMKKNLNSYYIKAFFDKDKKKSEFVKINMALDFTFIPLPQLIDFNIHSENEIIEIDNEEYTTKLIACNYLYLENNENYNLDNFNFYSLNKSEIFKDFTNMQSTAYVDLFKGQIGLSPLYESENLNILYTLKQNKIINKMSFGFNFNNIKQIDNDFLFFGEIKEDKNKNIITKFDMNKKLIKKYNKWGFKLDAIVVEKTTGLIKHVKHKYFAYFNIIEDRIFVPDKIMEYLISRIFNTYIKNKVCFVTEYSDKKFINCYKKKISQEKNIFPNIYFVIDNYGFKLTYDDLFISSINSNELIFIIQKNYYDIDTNIILLGSRFLKKYTTEFDLEQDHIIFHSENVLQIIDLAQIEDDFWKDMIRDYNTEIEHYDSNWGNENEDKDIDESDSDIDNDDIDKNGNDINTNKDNENKEINNDDNTREINDNNNDNLIYKEYLKYFLIFFIIIIIIIGIFKFFKVRKNIRINKEKAYFKEPFNEEKNEE